MELTAIILVFLLATVVQYVVDIIKGAIPPTAIGQVKLAPIYSLIVGVAYAKPIRSTSESSPGVVGCVPVLTPDARAAPACTFACLIAHTFVFAGIRCASASVSRSPSA